MVHPTCHLFFPDSLLPLIQQRRRREPHLNHFQFIGFYTRNRVVSRLENVENELIEVSLLAIRPQTETSPHDCRSPCDNYSDKREQEPQVLGQLVVDDEPLEPPAWTFTQVPSVFITLRVAEGALRVERLMVDTDTLNPDPQALLLFHYTPTLLHQAQHLCQLPQQDSGLPAILTKMFHPSRSITDTDDDDLILLHGKMPRNEDELKNDPFGNWTDSCPETSGVKGKILSRSQGVKQFLLRMELLSKLCRRKLSVLGGLNLMMLLLVDILCGILLSKFLHSFPHLYSTLHNQVHHLLKLLLQLLHWLRGSPAGLKLNSALNTLLWRFFSYHLHLWANYIGILEPILSLILSTIIWVGPIGFTLQLSLMKDLLSMATFHVYCLYIYATRLYRMLMITIVSLGRVFLGRKWNPLRNRVDHVHLSISELFLSALFFTIAIFLAPTVIIYYAVFLSLRLPVVIVEAMLGYIIDIMNGWRLVTSHLIFMNSPRVCDQVFVEPFDSGVGRPPEFHIRLQAKATKFAFSFPSPPFPIIRTISQLLQGEVLAR